MSLFLGLFFLGACPSSEVKEDTSSQLETGTGEDTAAAECGSGTGTCPDSPSNHVTLL